MAKILLLSFLILSTLLAAVTCNIEVDALYAWKQNLIDPNNVLQSWDPTLVNPCTWFHITCNMFDSVVRVDLGNANLSGTLVPQLGQLTNLQYLEVYSNGLTGNIPWVLGNLSNLISLHLHNNFLTGPIPDTFSSLHALKWMRVSNNGLSGSIPPKIGNLTNLVELHLHFNHISGSIPSTLGNLKNLASLRLNGNNLTGVIPLRVLQLVLLGNLRLLDVSENSLAGSANRSISTHEPRYAVTKIIQDPVG